uniref:Nucleoprotein TPR-like n=1 Tax=Hippocampus comes TaxID=109280 RepID=A0A3Q3DI37_HIPCM
MAAALLQVLERAELNKLTKGVQNKLEKFVTELQNANEALRTQQERFKADSEQQYFDIDKKLGESQEQILSLYKICDAMTKMCLSACIGMQQYKSKYEIEAEKKELARLLEKRTQEVENLTEDVKRLNEKLMETNKVKLELQLKLDEIQSSEASVQHREKRMEQEKELLDQKIEWLSAELKTKTEELLSSNRETGKEILELRGSLKSETEQLCVGNDELSAMEEKYRNELNAHIKLSSLYKEQLESMCPSAAAIAAIVKPGMKFFDLYNAYSECEIRLQLEKQETRRVNKVLDEVIQEVESKAPVLKRQREEYETMQNSMASLWNKLEQARTEIYRLQKEKDEAKQQCDNLEKDKLRTERLLDDTSTQVCALLVELEEARGHQVTKDDGTSSNISGQVTRQQQISFRSVEELQAQNRSLLERLRKLEEESTRQQAHATSTRISELEAVVDKLQKEAEQLRDQRNQQKQLADSNARQRDMYKALLTQSTGGLNLPSQDFSPPAPTRPSAPVTRSTPQRAAAVVLKSSMCSTQCGSLLLQLHDAFTLYKKEKAENDRMLNDSHDRLERQLTEVRSSNARLTSQVEFSNKRYEMLQETVTAFRRETSALQDRNQKMSETVLRYEHIIHTMTQDLRQVNEKLALEEVRVENLTKERDILKQAESRLNREKEVMLAEQRNQNLLLTNLKTIQLTMEHTDTDIRHRLNSKIENLETELASMKTRLEQEVAQRHTLGRNMDAQLVEAKKQLQTQNTLQQKTRELLKNSEQQVAALKAQLASVSSEGTSTPVTRAATLRTPVRVRSPVQTTQQPGPSELAEVKSNLNAAEEQNSKLTEQLTNANATVEQYRAVVLTLEDSLKNEKEESEDIQKQLENRILEVEKKNQQAQEERRKSLDTLEKQVSDLQRSLKASQAEQQDALERAARAVALEQNAIQESLLQTKQAGEAQAKYERELMLHAADVEVLKELKKALQQEAERKREIEEQLNKSNTLLEEKTTGWTTLEKQLKDELVRQSLRGEELGRQNALLHQQMDEMAARSHRQQPQQQQLDLSFNEEGKTLEQIQEILRFVRKEKEIAVAQGEASEGEALRYKQRMEHQNRELKELQEALNTEREKLQATTKTLAQKEAQLNNMGDVGTLQETNKLLKMDREQLEQELQQAQAKVKKLESNISPLNESLYHLSDRNGSLQADKRLLEEDIKHLKAKVQQLVSQQKDGDVQEKQKVTAEREAQQRRISQLVEETAKLKTELARSSTSTNSAQSQAKSLRESVTRLTAERDALKKEVGTKNNDILEKNKTITQVKKIGRRYKTQYEELKAQHDKVGLQFVTLVFNVVTQNQLKSAQCQAQARQSQIQRIQKELLQTKDSLQQNLTSHKKLQETHQQEINNLKSSLNQAESQNKEEKLRQQMADKEEKTKKAFVGAKTKINQLNSAKENLSKEVEDLKQCKEELEVRMNAMKSQYEGRLLRLDRELRETQTHSEPREESQDQTGSKVGDQNRSGDQRQLSLKSPAQDRSRWVTSGFIAQRSSLSEPPTANIRPTPSAPSPSNKPSPSPGSKSTPRASIRPMVTPATVPMPTPTATVMPTTQTESQEEEEEDDDDEEDGDDASSAAMKREEESSEEDGNAEEDGQQPSVPTGAEEDHSQGAPEPSRGSDTGESEAQKEAVHVPPTSSPSTPSPSTSSLTLRLPQPRRPPHSLPPRLYIQPPASELGPPHTQRQSSQLRRPSVGRGPQLTPGIGSMQHFFDDDDRMVPSTPTLVVPHRTDGFAEAIHSPQVAGLSTRFRFGPPEDLLPQTSASHSDLGQLASQGGLGMYESPLFLAAHDEDGGGRSVPTTPLQVAAPVTVFTESLPSDSGDNMASQSVPMVTASTGMSTPGDDGDEVFMEQEEGPPAEASLDSRADMETAGQQSEDASLPSTSQDADSSTIFNTLCSKIRMVSLLVPRCGGKGFDSGLPVRSQKYARPSIFGSSSPCNYSRSPSHQGTINKTPYSRWSGFFFGPKRLTIQ